MISNYLRRNQTCKEKHTYRIKYTHISYSIIKIMVTKILQSQRKQQTFF